MGVRGGEYGLDEGHRYVFAAIAAVATDRPIPTPPPGDGWQQRAAQHEVLSVLAAHLPSEPALTRVRRLHAAHHLLIRAELRRVQGAFELAGIEWLLFKGPVLDNVVYQCAGARGYSDLDVLVRPADVERAVGALESIGARTIDQGWAGMQAIDDGESTYCTPAGVMIDLHWDVVNDMRIRPSFAMTTENLFRRSREVTVDGMTVATFDAVDTLLHVVLHACLSGGDRLKWLLDIHQCLLRCAGSEAVVDELATETRLRLPIRVMCARVRRFVDETTTCPLEGRPSSLERAWLAADAAMVHRHPPGARHEGRASGALVPAATRADGASSCRALAAAVPGRSVARMTRPRRPDAALSGCVKPGVTRDIADSTSGT